MRPQAATFLQGVFHINGFKPKQNAKAEIPSKVIAALAASSRVLTAGLIRKRDPKSLTWERDCASC